jgi:regulator of replication initiation timing
MSTNNDQLNTEKKTNKNLKAVIVVLALLFLGAIGYIIKLSSDVKQTHTELTQTISEKDSIIADLEALKVTYDQAIAENTELSEELKEERAKVVKLIEEVKQAKATSSSLGNYKKRYQELEGKFNALIRENEELKLANEGLTQVIDSTSVILVEEREYSQKLLGQNEELSKIVDEASKLAIQNLKTSAYKVRNSGKEVETEKARRADILKIQFTIAENKVAKQGDRNYYVQVIDSKMNVLGEKKTVEFGEQSLTYSFVSTVDFKNSTVNVSENIPGDNFEKGLYHVHIFDGNQLLASQSFTLK